MKSKVNGKHKFESYIVFKNNNQINKGGKQLSKQRKVRFMIYDTYGDLSGKPVPLDISKEEHDQLIKESSDELRESYGFLYDTKKDGGGSLLTGTRARSLTSLTEATLTNTKNAEAKYKKIINWSRDIETEDIPQVDNLVLTSTMFMWGVTNSGWKYNKPQKIFGGEVNTQLHRQIKMGIPRVDRTLPDDQHIQFLTYMVEMFTDEGDVVWDAKGNIPDLATICEELNREFVSGKLDKDEWDYNSDIEYGDEPYELDLSDLEENPVIHNTTAKIDTIEQGDCFEWLNTIEDESWDLLLTDPPYNVSDKSAQPFAQLKTGFDFGDWDYGFDTRRWINQVAPKVKQGGVAVIYNSYKNMELMARVLEEWGYTIVGMPYWSKTNPLPHLMDRVPLNGIESYLLAVRGNIEDLKVNIDEINEVEYRPSTKDYVVHDRHYYSPHAEQNKRFHTTQKPEGLFKEHILMYSQVGDIVGDTFSGSGTTAVGCRDLGRHFYTVEQDDEYFAKSNERLEKDVSSKKRVLT